MSTPLALRPFEALDWDAFSGATVSESDGPALIGTTDFATIMLDFCGIQCHLNTEPEDDGQTCWAKWMLGSRRDTREDLALYLLRRADLLLPAQPERFRGDLKALGFSRVV